MRTPLAMLAALFVAVLAYTAPAAAVDAIV